MCALWCCPEFVCIVFQKVANYDSVVFCTFPCLAILSKLMADAISMTDQNIYEIVVKLFTLSSIFSFLYQLANILALSTMQTDFMFFCFPLSRFYEFLTGGCCDFLLSTSRAFSQIAGVVRITTNKSFVDAIFHCVIRQLTQLFQFQEHMSTIFMHLAQTRLSVASCRGHYIKRSPSTKQPVTKMHVLRIC